MKNYSTFYNGHNPVIDMPTDREVVAVLDGQQRLTSLNIGLRGPYSYKVHGGWSNKPWSYPERRLYLNLLGEAPENEFGLKYHFQFLTKTVLGSGHEPKHLDDWEVPANPRSRRTSTGHPRAPG